MTGWKLTLSLVCWTVLLSLWGLGAQAAGFAPSLSQTEGEPGDVVEVLLPYDGSWGDIAAFRVDVEYDPQVFEYVRYQGSDAVSQGTVTVREEEGKVEGVFTASGSGPCFTQGEYLTLRFRVMEEAPAGSGLLFVSLYEISSPGPELVWESVDISLTFRVPEPPSSDARLLSLVPDNGVLDPVFDPDCFSYRVTVPYEVETMTFLAEPAAGALCRVNRKNLGSGGSDTVFTITVTAEDGKTKNVYQVVVHRLEKEEPEYSDDARLLSLVPATGTLEPAFSPETLSYTLTVPFSVTTMTFTAEAVEGATYRVNRKNLGAGGSDTPFTITVTAEDGETKSVYQVMVHRQEKEEEEKPVLSDSAKLLSLVPATGTLEPAFSPETLSYTLTVPFSVTTMTFTAEAVEGATYRVNRKNLGAGGSDTPFTITVTAEDGETKSVYQVMVHRQEKEEEEKPVLSDSAKLLSLVPATGTLEPAFSPETLSYTLTVPFSVTTMTFDAEAVEGATYRVNRKNLGAGGSDTPFTITVTAADGETKSVYQVMVHRQEKSASTNASGGTSASNEGGDSSKPGSGSGGDGTEESGALSENAQGNGEAMVQEQGDPGAAENDFTPAGGEDSSSAGGLLLQNGDSSLLPGMIAMLCFVLFCFLSEPLAKSLAKRFPEKRAADSSEKDPPAST